MIPDQDFRTWAQGQVQTAAVGQEEAIPERFLLEVVQAPMPELWMRQCSGLFFLGSGLVQTAQGLFF